MRVTVISDYICPWCYIASKRVEQFSKEFDVAVTWWPFELHPETPPEGQHADEILGRRGRATDEYRQRLKQYAADAGVKLASNRWVANSHRALELAEFARDRGRFEAAHRRLFRAYFEEGQNIGDPDILMEICEGVGLDPTEFAAEMRAGRYAGLVDHTTALARQKGFSSTPTMIFDDRFMLPGAQDYGVYVDVLKRLGARRRGAEAR